MVSAQPLKVVNSGFLPLRPRFYPSTVHVESVVNKAALDLFSSFKHFGFPLLVIILLLFQTYLTSSSLQAGTTGALQPEGTLPYII
jgi:hypothetical protein